jgi:transposase-like protein
MASRNNGKYDEDFKQGAVALVFETEKPIAQGAPRNSASTTARWAPGAPGRAVLRPARAPVS